MLDTLVLARIPRPDEAWEEQQQNKADQLSSHEVVRLTVSSITEPSMIAQTFVIQA